MFALVDCNNFFVSCERVFQPALEGMPVIVLSNNDGCAISRSNEAKQLGIRMGAPFFEIKNICDKHNIHVFSSNYTLYRDMSNRVMSILSDFAINQEIYSIDESFLQLPKVDNLTNYAQQIKDSVRKCTGIPVCIGIGQTKVLAKFANYLAKRYKFLNGICNLTELGESRVDRAMQITPVGEIWGVGKKLKTKLELMGIKTVYDLKNANAKQMSRRFSVHLERMIYELNAIECIQIENFAQANKQIISSRSFAKAIYDAEGLMSALSYHVEQISDKIRKQGLFARQMIVFANSNRFANDYFSHSVNITFDSALNSFRYMTKHLKPALEIIYKPNIAYKKAGIIVFDLVSNVDEIKDLFDNINIAHDKLLPTLEQIKRQFGKSAIRVSTTKLANNWHMQQDLKSKQYTTNLSDLLTVS